MYMSMAPEISVYSISLVLKLEAEFRPEDVGIFLGQVILVNQKYNSLAISLYPPPRSTRCPTRMRLASCRKGALLALEWEGD